MAPVDACAVLFVTFPVLVWAHRRVCCRPVERTCGRCSGGLVFGFGYFLAGLYWIGYAFLVDVKTFGWLLPLAVAGLPAYLALYTALGLGVARLMWVRGPRTHPGARGDIDRR